MHTKFALFTVRYSLFSPKLAGNWRIGQGDESHYADTLFDPARLEFRRHTFANITAPSIASAVEHCPEVYAEAHVLASTLLPVEDQDFLKSLEARYSFLRVFFQRPDEASVTAETRKFCEDLAAGAAVASIRIDDDDAVSRKYLEQLAPYITPEMNGRLVSLCSGYSAFALKDGRIAGPFAHKWRLGSAGLALIRLGGQTQGPVSVYGLGRHNTADDRAPTIVDAREPAFIRLFHDRSDTRASGATVSGEFAPEARDRFSISDGMWADPEELPSLHRLRLARRINYMDYRLHAALAEARFFGEGFRKRYRKKAQKRWRQSFDRPAG